MTDRTPPTKKAATTIPVSEPLRDKIRVEVAKQGMTYDEYLRSNLSVVDE
jgi:predicted DNA binding CopG/RHH family protein